ncbi:hybrid sensor histidine kinase/response regulator [Turneriella parva]|uniref:histidine kinase n=1 Tax=Turneriella parva (strain ATCC BAA-1111 / DSM 21527 / NCTC 11395 / H) TaxID=869212 RepID=I4B5K8_TURPD|nr:response regulator [Turneriella parva]AFM12565.1 integral membrane sensor hybrid histidine kinase [Turneriella parva DSM 21527]
MSKLLLALSCVGFLTACGDKRRAPIEAHLGVLDLRERSQPQQTPWDFERDGILEIKGDWEFYWSQLLDPTDFQTAQKPQPSALVRIPGRWNGLKLGDDTLSGSGFATYRLKIMLPGKNFLHDELLALRCRYQQTAYRIFWNGTSVASNGMVAATKAAYKPEYRPLTAKLPLTTTSEAEIIVQIANFEHRNGGFSIPLELGLAPQLTAYTRSRQLTEAFLLGALILLAAYFVGLYTFRNQDYTPAWFAITCIAIVFRTLVTGDRLVMILVPNANWELLLRIEYLSFMLANFAGIMYLEKLFVDETSRLMRKILLTGIVLTALPVVFSPPAIFTHTLLPSQIVIIVSLLYAFIVALRAVSRRRPGSVAIFIGFGVLAAVTINDIIYNQLLIGFGYLAPYGVFALVLTHAVALSSRLAAAFSQTENLKENLEVQVDMRTAELRQAIKVAEEANEAKAAFFAMMTHELRTPLNGIIGVSNILGNMNLTAEQTKYLNIVKDSSANLMSVINDILDFSLIDAGKLGLNKTEFALAETLEEVVLLGRTLIKDKSLDLTLAPLPPELPQRIVTDQGRLKQVIINLISNAVKFTPSGSVVVICGLLAHRGETYEIEISVEDTGIGISEQDQKKLFKPYSQADQSISRRYGGTGLGLVISSRIVEALGGKMRLTSVEGKGSCFSFSFEAQVPGAAVAKENDAPTDSAAGAEFAARYPLRILAVEDDAVNQVVITETLRSLGYEISLAENGREAVALAENKIFDLIFMDVQMPEMSGIEATERIRALTDGDRVAIVALTADSSAENRHKCFAAGIDDFLTKPFSPQNLQAALVKWSKGRSGNA